MTPSAMLTPYYSRKRIPQLPDVSSLPFPANLVRECSDCNLRAGCIAPVPAAGASPARVMLTGEAPGRNEDLWGVPFFGEAGKQLNSLLFQNGIVRDDIRINNTVNCRPPNNRTPKPTEIKACAKWLDMDISLTDPDIIVALGATATARYLGQGCGTMEHLHGKPISTVVQGRERIVLPAYHPAAALHNTTLLRQTADDFAVLGGLVRERPLSDFNVADEFPNPDYRVADTPKLLSRMRDEILSAGQVAIDTETVNQNTRLWSAQYSSIPGTGWFVPIAHNFKGRIDLSIYPNTQVIVHHYLSDIKWLGIPEDNFWDTMVAAYLTGQAQGLKELASRLCGIHMISYSEVVRPSQQKISLDYLTEASKHDWGTSPDIEETKWDNKAGRVVTKIHHPWNMNRKVNKLLSDMAENSDIDPYQRWRDIPDLEKARVEEKMGVMPESSLKDIKFEDAVQYATRDADATLRVKLKLEKMLSDAGLDFVFNIDTGILPMVNDMMKNGMAVDVDHFKRLSASYTTRMAEKAEEVAKIVGHSFNPNSSLQVAQVVYTELGFKPTAKTPSGEISTDDSELKKTKHPIAKGIIQYRGLLKLKSTYADNMIRSAHPDSEGVYRMHTVLKTTRVGTGRLSSAKDDNGEGANLQNIPTRNKEAKQIKRGFVAAPGKIMLEGDLGQIEMRTQAHLAKCKGLIDLFLRGDDPHTVTASKLFSVPYEEAKKDKYRYPCKRAGFGIIYLIGAEGLSSQINEYVADLEMDGEPIEVEPWDVETCERFIKEYYTLYPEIRDYQMEKAAEARRYGYTTDMFGRRRFIPEVNSPVKSVQEAGLRQAANFPVTASAQEIIKSAMVRLWQELPRTEWANDVRWAMQIHDSMVQEVNEDGKVWKPFAKWMRSVMCDTVKLLVPVTADFKAGVNWADMEKVKLD